MLNLDLKFHREIEKMRRPEKMSAKTRRNNNIHTQNELNRLDRTMLWQIERLHFSKQKKQIIFFSLSLDEKKNEKELNDKENAIADFEIDEMSFRHNCVMNMICVHTIRECALNLIYVQNYL